jgi:SAM-dependent methyltransferase
MKLATICRDIGSPAVLDRPGRMLQFAQELRRAGYELARCAERLDVFPRLGVNFWREIRPGWRARPQDPIDNLIALFIDGQPVRADLIAKQLSAAFIDAALEMRLVQRDGGMLRSDYCLFPCFGKYVVTDQADKNTAINQVMFLWGESYLLGGLVHRKPRRRAIDLGTGSGVHALLASEHCARAVGGDVSPRALAFANFNAGLNGAGNVDFVASDLLDSIEGSCDLLTANPPYAPDTAAAAGENFWSGGANGIDLLKRVVESLPHRLDEDGTAHVNSLFPNPPGTRIQQHFDAWLGGGLHGWEVLDHTWAVPGYEDLLSAEPFRGDKTAWRFGVVSLRRAASGKGWWKEVGGPGWFFHADGSCAVVADHDAPDPALRAVPRPTHKEVSIHVGA